jgi:hypothetical protein
MDGIKEATDIADLFIDEIHRRFDHILDYSHASFDSYYLIATLLDVNYGWTVPNTEHMAHILYTMVSMCDLRIQ